MEEILSKLYDYFKKLDLEDRFSQAFIIGNVDYSDIKDELNKVFANFLFKNDNIENNPDIYLLGIDDSPISKEDIKQLLNNISTTSQFNNIKIYIINKCEELNVSSCNALLKTIEEPEKGIYTFLITNNIDNVLPTIISRCQKIFLSANSNLADDNDFEELSSKLINEIETTGLKTIAKNYNIYNDIEDRNSLSIILNNMLKKYNNALKFSISGRNCDNIIIEKNDIETITKKILIINNNINRLNNYLNKNLSIDRFIIEMWRCNK